MKVLLIFGALIATTAAATGFVELVLEEWNTYKATNDKKFDNAAQDKFRLKAFLDNRLQIAKHNARYARGEVSYALEVNRFADMPNTEFVNVMNGFNRTARQGAVGVSGAGVSIPIPRSTYEPSPASLPDRVDWRERGAVTPVKDQGQCGSCYSFSATGSLEGQSFKKTGHLISLSEQNILDCSREFGNQGCNGGLMDNVFKYIKQNGGVDTETSYPYQAKDGQCHYDPQNEGATDIGMVDIPSGDEEALRNAVATVGPVSVAIDARHLQAYKEGIFYDDKCDPQNLDHGVLVVGYGTDAAIGKDYWLVKNSWGADWGEDGYFRLARNSNNHCGIASQASYPVV